MNIWTGYEGDQIKDLLVNSVHNIGSVKEFVYYGMSDEDKKIPDFTVVKVPQFWDYTGNKSKWKKLNKGTLYKTAA